MSGLPFEAIYTRVKELLLAAGISYKGELVPIVEEDGPPPLKTKMPYIQIQSEQERTEGGTKTTWGHETETTIHVFTSKANQLQVANILGQVTEAIREIDNITGYNIKRRMIGRSDIRPESEGNTIIQHGSVVLELNVQEV